jgi:protein-S-isoprenylcysteine O-methyltransferase Ste14
VLVFPCLPVALVSATVAALIVCRTILEERMLVAGLPGYDAYRQTTRWRLIPYLF